MVRCAHVNWRVTKVAVRNEDDRDWITFHADDLGCCCSAEREDGVKKCYIAGPMTNIPDENFPAFDAAAARFRAAGWTVHNPAELSRQHRAANPDRAIPTNSYRDFIPVDIAAIATCDAMALLPGWEASRRVRVELYAAELIGLAILDAETMESYPAAETRSP